MHNNIYETQIQILISVARTHFSRAGHVQRGGSPTAYDRILATRYGVAAIDLVHEGTFGCMVALKGSKIVPVLLKDVAGKQKTVDLELYDIANIFFD